MMGGKIWVESELGQGSAFHFTCRSECRPKSSRAGCRAPEILRGCPCVGRGRQSHEPAHPGRRCCRDWHMKPTVGGRRSGTRWPRNGAAESGEPFSLILIDMQMPKMDGFTLAEQIKRHPECTDLTIMMLTSASQRGDVARCREIGLTSYLHQADSAKRTAAGDRRGSGR